MEEGELRGGASGRSQARKGTWGTRDSSGQVPPKPRALERKSGFWHETGEGVHMTTGQATKRCPACAENVFAEALVCRHCGYDYRVGLVPGSQQTSGMAIASMILGILWLFWIGSLRLSSSVMSATAKSRSPTVESEEKASPSPAESSGGSGWLRSSCSSSAPSASSPSGT